MLTIIFIEEIVNKIQKEIACCTGSGIFRESHSKKIDHLEADKIENVEHSY